MESLKKRIVVIGGVAAGPKAASRARRLDQSAEITLIQREQDLSMASCGYPYYVGGWFNDRNQLLSAPTGAVRNPGFFQNVKDITALVNTEAESIDRAAHTVACRNLDTGEMRVVEYDKLVIATGAKAVVPPIPGVQLEGITTLQSMRDTDYLRRACENGKGTKAVIVGGGLIGVEAAEALTKSGIDVTLVEMLPQILSFLDVDLSMLAANHMRAKGVDVRTGDGVTEFLGEDGRVTSVRLASGVELACGLVVLAVGVRPNTQLAAKAGLALGARGGIQVDEYLQTSDPDIYAAGDCIEIPHRLTGKPVLAPLGDLANLEGRVAGQNAVMGNTATFLGTVLTGVCKVFDFTVGSTGFSEAGARAAGYPDAVSALSAGPDKPHYMAGALLITRLVAEPGTGLLLGMQCIGPGDASKRIAAAAMALQGRLTVHDLVNADLPYAPPYSPAIDPLIVAAHTLENKMLGVFDGISSVELKRRLDAGDKPFLLDVRGPDEFEQMRLGVGETLIPLGALRKRVGELPQDKSAEIVCYCKISLRGYEAARFLMGNGWTNVKVLEGGLAAWPYPREK